MSNSTVEIYRGHAVRRYNKLQIRVSQYEFKKFIDAKIDMGMSARDVLEYSNTPCQNCDASILTNGALKKFILKKK